MAIKRLPPEVWFPAGINGISARQLLLPSGNSLRVLEAGDAGDPPVVLLHGWAISSYLWRHNILTLARTGRRVIAIDLPGHGLSDSPSEPDAYTLPSFVRTLHAALDALGVVRTDIVAQSMAGKICAQYAMNFPERVSSLILFGPVGFGVIPPWHVLAKVVPDLPERFASHVVPRQVVAASQRHVYGTLAAPSDADIDEYWAPTQFPELVRAQFRMLKEFDWKPWTEESLVRLKVPTLVVFGTLDRTVRPSHTEELVAALPEGSLEWIVGGGHVVMEEVPGQINDLLTERLRR